MSTVRFQVLWHSVAIEVSDDIDGLADVPGSSWPMTPLLETRYGIVRNDDGWAVRQDADEFMTADSRDAAWTALRVRILARSFEIAVRKGWSAFTGSVITSGDERICLVGPAEERRQASQSLARSGAVVDSHDGWIARDGDVLPVPVSVTQSTQELTIRPADRLLLWRPDDLPPTGPDALLALLDCADRSCQKAGETVRSVTAILNKRHLSGITASEIPGWYVA